MKFFSIFHRTYSEETFGIIVLKFLSSMIKIELGLGNLPIF